jgi:hypothetical protein
VERVERLEGRRRVTAVEVRVLQEAEENATATASAQQPQDEARPEPREEQGGADAASGAAESV